MLGRRYVLSRIMEILSGNVRPLLLQNFPHFSSPRYNSNLKIHIVLKCQNLYAIKVFLLYFFFPEQGHYVEIITGVQFLIWKQTVNFQFTWRV